MSDVLHEDDTPPDWTTYDDGGRPVMVRNLTAEEYAATYDDGEPHAEPPSLAELQAAAQEGRS